MLIEISGELCELTDNRTATCDVVFVRFYFTNISMRDTEGVKPSEKSLISMSSDVVFVEVFAEVRWVLPFTTIESHPSPIP